MLYSLKVTGGFASKLPAFAKGMTFEFSPGLNILFGPNGCGKTTALKILAAYSGIEGRGGWSKYARPSIKMDKDDYTKVCAKCAPGDCTAEVDWDGYASFLNMAEVSDSVPQFLGENADGISDASEEIMSIMSRPSGGQLRVHKLGMVCKATQNPPDLLKLPNEHKSYNDIWKKMMEGFVAFVQACRDRHKDAKGRITILWDEPDRSLSIPTQALLWGFTKSNVGLPIVAQRCQVIVATHSPFALFVNDCFVHGMEGGYVEKCREVLKNFTPG